VGRFLEAADVLPTMIVGVHGLTDEMLPTGCATS
jgi:hypothetical protein